MYFTKEKDEEKIKIEQIYFEHRDRLYWIAYNILNNRMLSEDAVHETIIRAMGHLHNIDEDDYFKTAMFLVVICRNISIDIYRRNKRIWRSEIAVEDIDVYEMSSESNPLEIYITNENLKGLINTIKQFDEIYSDGSMSIK